jgi:hypothetical protein
MPLPGRYLQQALQARKAPFAADMARLFVIIKLIDAQRVDPDVLSSVRRNPRAQH